MTERNTIQCDLVLQTVAKLHNHPTADEVHEAIVKDYPYISRGTVYRNLNKLVKNKKIRRVETTDGPDCFDHQLFDHYHVRCLKCGKVFDADMEYLNLENKINDTQGFEILGHTLVFSGICPKCNGRFCKDSPGKTN